MQDESTSKPCVRCGEEKSLSDFYPARGTRTRRDGLQSYCKICAREGADEWRRNNLERSRAWQRQNRAKDPDKHRRWDNERYANSPAVRLTLEAREVPCVDCGIQLPPAVMELDHVRGEKSFGFGGAGARDRDPDLVRAEIAKCDVRCPNCHRLRHYLEREERKAARGS